MPFVMLAFGFASPILLWGLLVAGVPLLIQWLHRRKYTERVWAAMRFLRAATESQTRRLRMESLLLLCVRTMILLLAALALAEPFLESTGWISETSVATNTLILLDTSLSMQATVDGVQVSEHARDAARNIIKSGDTGDSYQLLTIAAQPKAVIRQPSFSPDDVLSEIDRIAATEAFGDVPEAIARTERLLKETSRNSRQRVVIISDFQRGNWRLEDPTAQERTRKALTGIARSATVLLIPVGNIDLANAAVQEAHVESSLVSAGAPTTITAQVRNFGSVPLRQQRLQLLEEGRVLQTQSVDVPPYSEVTSTFVTQWSEPGAHPLQIRLEDDPLTPDNDRWLTVDVRERLSVLLVNGRVSERALEGATDFVELALRPTLTAETDRSSLRRSSWTIQPTVISEAELLRTELSGFDCIFICDVPFLSDDEITRLETFVRGGGGLVIGMGDQVQLDSYSRQLTASGTGLLPVQLSKVVGERTVDSEPFHFGEPIAGHPLTRAFAGNPRSGLTTANIYRYVDVRLPEDSSARRALEFSQGAPAMIEQNYGAGRVVLVTTSLDDQWGNWALWPSFLPMMHELVEYVVGGEAAGQSLVGQPLYIELPILEGLGGSLDLTRPDGRRTALHSSRSPQTATMIVDETSQSGVYRLAFGPPNNLSKLFAVNIDTRESDLRSLGDEGLQNSVLGSIRFERGGSAVTPNAASTSPSSGSKLATWLLVAVLVLLFVEQLMAWNGRYGFIALLIGPCLVAAFALLPSASLILLAGGSASMIVWRWKHRLVPASSGGKSS